MTNEMPTHEDSETRAHYLWRIALAYDVPMNLIRYEEINNTERTDLCGLSNNDSE